MIGNSYGIDHAIQTGLTPTQKPVEIFKVGRPMRKDANDRFAKLKRVLERLNDGNRTKM